MLRYPVICLTELLVLEIAVVIVYLSQSVYFAQDT